MIIDKINNYSLYSKISNKIARGFNYILTTDFSQLADGKYEIDEDLFAIVQEYNTKPKLEGKLENHKKHIDIQYMIQGEEMMGIATFNNQKPVLQNEESDYSFYETESSLIKVEEGMFTIFFPDDLHMPCIEINSVKRVKKVVVKIKI